MQLNDIDRLRIDGYGDILRFLKIAQQVALKSNHKVRLGAIVVQKRIIVSAGFNRVYKTHPCTTNPYRHLHAEVDACVGVARERLKNGTMFVYRETKNGHIALSKPCVDCIELINLVGIRRIYYTDPLAPEYLSELK